MVLKRLIPAMTFLSLSAQAATPPIVLRWEGAKAPRCQRLVEAFLAELRSMASDRVIELEAMGTDKSPHALVLGCPEARPGDAETLTVAHGADSLPMRFLPKANGFDAMDWLPFQQRYLAAPVNLAPAAREEPALPRTASVSETRIAGESLLQRWWFWALVAGAGAGVYAVAKGAGAGTSSINVEIR